MRNDLRPIAEGDVVLLKDGRHALIVTVSPVTKLMKTDRDRDVSIRIGKVHQKAKLNFGDNFVVEDERNNTAISFDLSKIVNMTISELYPKICFHYGNLEPEKFNNVKKMIGDAISRL